MKIKKVSLYRKEMPMICGKFTCSLEPGVDNAEVIITRIETDCGLVGYGESGAVGSYPMYAPGILASSAELIERHLMDKDPCQLGVIQQTMNMIPGQGAIKTGFDMACWDILGKSLGQPLHALLGGKLQEKAPLYRSITHAPPADMVQTLNDWRLEGYRQFQFRVGHGDMQLDLARIQSLLAEKRDNEMFTVDVAGNWRVDHALHILNRVRDLDFTIEQPCWTVDDCRSVRERDNLPIKLDNSLNSVNDVLRAYATNACDSIVLHINKFGGISPARVVRDIVGATTLGITYSTQWGTEITTAALTHLALTTSPNNLITTIDAHNYSPATVATNNPIVVDNGEMWMANDDPGLGVAVDNEALGELVKVIQ